jgi:hypothetical protein
VWAFAGEIGLLTVGAGFAAREGEIESRSFLKIFFNMTIEAGKPLRITILCNLDMPADAACSNHKGYSDVQVCVGTRLTHVPTPLVR